jgi:dipeptidyl aminopeptidase/acylaminoacyl peptidase
MTPQLSRDGAWFAYVLAPNDGDAQVVVRRTHGTGEYRFPMGDVSVTAPRAPSPARDLAISPNGRWLAFPVVPTEKERKALKAKKQPEYNAVAIVDLSNGTKTIFQKIRRFAFNGDDGDWIALQGYTPTGPGADSSVHGADLTLTKLGSDVTLHIGDVDEFAFNEHGTRLAWTTDAPGRAGNTVEYRDLRTAVVRSLDATPRARYSALTWSDSGNVVGVVRTVVDSATSDSARALIVFTKFATDGPHKSVFASSSWEGLPSGYTIAANGPLHWSADERGLYVGIRPSMQQPRYDLVVTGTDSIKVDTTDALPSLILWHWKDPRLQSQQQVEEGKDKAFSYTAYVSLDNGKLVPVADSTMRLVTTSDRSPYAVGIDISNYELAGNMDGKRYADIYVTDVRTGKRTLVLTRTMYPPSMSPDGKTLAYYSDRDGQYYAYDLATGARRNLTATVPTTFVNTEDDHNVVRPPRPSLGWSRDGANLLLTDGWDIWVVPVRGGTPTNLTQTGKRDRVRYSLISLSPDERDVDLGKPVYFATYGEWTKKGGISRHVPGKAALERLLWDDADYSLIKAEHSDVYAYTRETDTTFPDYYLTDATFKPATRLTDANPDQEKFVWSGGSRLIDYVSDKGDTLQAALYLPADYQPGKSYPTVVNYYEKLSQRMHSFKAPSPTEALNIALYTSRGYAVLQPDIVYRVNDPGMSAVWCVVPAVKAAIATGIVDRDHIGITGHSWGGYQTAFLVTQTNMFKAAIAGAPLTDMVSMYLSVYWNSGGSDMAIFESSQGRFAGPWWENWDAYYRNSPIFHAKDVTTPLIILDDDKDGAVDPQQGIEYYNTLRRMGKPVVMLRYMGENHGLFRPENQKDYARRMREFFDYYLKGAPAPKWWTDGLPYLQIQDRLRALRAEEAARQ